MLFIYEPHRNMQNVYKFKYSLLRTRIILIMLKIMMITNYEIDILG